MDVWFGMLNHRYIRLHKLRQAVCHTEQMRLMHHHPLYTHCAQGKCCCFEIVIIDELL